MRILALFVLAGYSICSHASDWTDIRVSKGSLLASQGTNNEQFIDIRGAWAPQIEYATPRIPKHNASSISCSRAKMTCTESQALIDLLRNVESGTPPYLSVFTFEYEVTDWTDELIKAHRVNPRGVSLNATLRIYPKKATVVLDSVESPGDKHFQPSEQHYEIEIDGHYATPATWPALPPGRTQ